MYDSGGLSGSEVGLPMGVETVGIVAAVGVEIGILAVVVLVPVVDLTIDGIAVGLKSSSRETCFEIDGK